MKTVKAKNRLNMQQQQETGSNSYKSRFQSKLKQSNFVPHFIGACFISVFFKLIKTKI